MRLSVILSNEAARPVPLHRATDPGGGRNANPAPAPGRHQGNVDERGGSAATGAQDLAEFRALSDASIPAQSSRDSPGLDLGRQYVPDLRALRPQALPTLGPTPLDHQATAPRSHADEEAMGPSSATIVGLERSLHCLLESLRKVEPRMLSGIPPIVKIALIRGPFREPRHAIVSSSRGVLFVPPPSPFLRGSRADPPPFF